MLSQLSSDVITPPPIKPKMRESPKIETQEIKEQSIIPVTKDEPEHVVKSVLNEMPKPIVELPEETGN